MVLYRPATSLGGAVLELGSGTTPTRVALKLSSPDSSSVSPGAEALKNVTGASVRLRPLLAPVPQISFSVQIPSTCSHRRPCPSTPTLAKLGKWAMGLPCWSGGRVALVPSAPLGQAVAKPSRPVA